jgi:hypothetical protein
LVETAGAAVTLMKSTMTEVGHLNSVEQHITAAIKNSIYFEWIMCAGCSLHHQQIIDGIVRIYIPWWCRQRNGLMSEAARQRATKIKINILAHQSVNKEVMPLYFHLVMPCPYAHTNLWKFTEGDYWFTGK